MHKRGRSLERDWNLVFSFLLLSSLLLLSLQVYAQTENIFDNFENYQVGSFPSAGGWEIVWSGLGQSYQVISTSYSYSPVSAWPGKKVYYDDVRVFTVVQQQSYLRVRLDSATLNGQDLSTSNPELRVNPGSRITGTITITVENVQPGSWITPVIWVTSWERGTVADGRVRVVASDIRTTRQFTVNIDVTAPSSPGTYYIGFFAGWMYNADEVASNDHPPNYGDGDDVWDMPGQGWEEVISNGQASTGPYRMPGRAVRIVVQQPQVTAKLQVGIRHTCIGDLRIWVGVEGGREVLIWNRDGGCAQNLFREWDLLRLGFTVNDLPPSESKRWYLRIKDEARGDEGRLEYFRIIYQGQTYESQDHPEIKDFQEVRGWIPSRGVPSGEFVIKGSATFLNGEPMKGGYIIIEPILPSIAKYVLSVGEVGENGEFVVKFPTSYGGVNIPKVKVTPYYRGIYFSSTSREIRLSEYPESTATLNFRVPYIGSPGPIASKAFIRDDRGENIIVVEVEPRTISKNNFTTLNFYIYVMPQHIYDFTLTKAILNVFFREDILVDKFGLEPKPGKFAFISIASESGWKAYSPPPEPRNLIDQILDFFSNLIGPAVSELIGQFIPGFGLLQAIFSRYWSPYIFGSGPPQFVVNLDPNDWDVWQASWDEYGTSPLPGMQGWLGANVSFKIRGPINRAIDNEEAYYYLKIYVRRQAGGPLTFGWVSLEQKIILQVSG